MAIFTSNIKYPEDSVNWFIRGDRICIISNVDGDGNKHTSARKRFKAIQESVTDGLLIHYYGEPNSVSAVTDSLDIDNTMHLAIVDYVKKCLYMDKAGVSVDGNISAMAAQMSKMHEKNFNDAIIRYGMKKRDKTGGSRVLKSISLM